MMFTQAIKKIKKIVQLIKIKYKKILKKQK